MVKIWLDFNFAEAYLNTSLFINIKIIIIIYLLFNYLRTGPFLFAIATRLLRIGPLVIIFGHMVVRFWSNGLDSNVGLIKCHQRLLKIAKINCLIWSHRV